MTLTIAIAAFVLFSIVGIIAGTRRLAPHIQRRPRHRETHEERLARVAERRRAFKNFFSGLFCGLFGYEEKMDGQDPQGQDLRDSTAGGTYQQEDDTTMEQELVGLRNAADMVSNLIAAEEGRNNQMLQHHLHQQQQQGGDFPGEAPPPSYENDAVEAIMVADGFQYTPGGTGYSPSSPTDNDGGEQGTSNSDRLGYGNKD